MNITKFNFLMPLTKECNIEIDDTMNTENIQTRQKYKFFYLRGPSMKEHTTRY